MIHNFDVASDGSLSCTCICDDGLGGYQLGVDNAAEIQTVDNVCKADLVDLRD